MTNKSESLELAKTFLGREVTVEIDRPMNTSHPDHGFIYEVNYGFIPHTKAPDGEELDAYVLGVDHPIEVIRGICIAIIHRKDNDDDKLVVVPKEQKELPTDQEIMSQVNFQEQWFDSKVIRD